MSYILDSLKKSEQKRQQNGVPDIHTTHVSEDSPRRHLWPYLLLVALVVNAALLFWWLGPWSGTTAELQSEAVFEKSLITSENTQPVLQSEVPLPRETLRDTALMTAPVNLQVKEQAIDETRKDHAAVHESELKPGDSEGQSGFLADSGLVVKQQEPESVAVVVETLDPQPAVATTPVLAAVNETVSPRPQRLYRPAELPAQIAAQLPQAMSLTLHYYSRLPKTRMVRINGRNLRQGADLKSGVSVDEITPHGVVLQVSGYRVWVEKP